MSQRRVTPYSELLQDFRWLERRDHIIRRAEGRCEECGADDVPWNALNVHHRHYRAGALPWEYEDDDLVCLCRDCHEVITDEIERAHRLIGRLPIAAFPDAIAALHRVLANKYPLRVPATAPGSFEDDQ